MGASNATWVKLHQWADEAREHGPWIGDAVVPQHLVNALNVARDEHDSMEPLLFIVHTAIEVNCSEARDDN